MSWVKLDDSFADHPKIEGITDKALRVYVNGLCYAARHRTDGRIPKTVADRWGSRHVRGLVVAGLWEEFGGGFAIHDFLEYNPSRAQIEAERDATRARRSGDSRPTDRRQNADARVRVRDGFLNFWNSYPRKVGKAEAQRKFEKAVEQGVDPEVIVQAALRFAADPNRTAKYTPHPATWLHQGRYSDESPLPSDTPAERPTQASVIEMSRRLEQGL